MIPKKFKKPVVDRKAEEVYQLTFQHKWDKVLELIQQGTVCNYQSAWGRTALHSALFQNHVASAPENFFEELVASSKTVIDLPTDSGNVSLRYLSPSCCDWEH
jgi:hypothetical protein